jgi:predicted metal-dependent phosphoesterase TrpH
MRADLHTHSSRSDGVLPPAELVRQAAAVGLDCLALTDHDSVAGIDEAWHAAGELGVRLIAGVELSVRDAHGNDDHLLGLFIDPNAESLVAWLRRLQADRERMADRTIAELERLGVAVSRARVADLAQGAVVTRPHIARALVEAGHVATEQEAFDRFLGSGRPAAPKRPSAEPAAAIASIHAAGGIACLAHPVFCQEPDALERLTALPPRLDHLVDAGLVALECFYPDATPEVSRQLADLAGARKLIATGGSDYHGPGKAPYAPLGQPSVDGEVIEALTSVRPGPLGWRI